MSDFSFMRSGPGSMEVNNNLSNDFLLQLSGGLSVFMEKAIENAFTYVEHSKRRGITSKDVSMALKREVLAFGNRNNIQTEIREAVEELKEISELSDCADDSENSEEESDSDFGSEPDSMIESEEFCKSECLCTICKEMNSVDEWWDTWEPDVPLEITFKNAIDLADQSI